MNRFFFFTTKFQIKAQSTFFIFLNHAHINPHIINFNIPFFATPILNYLPSRNSCPMFNKVDIKIRNKQKKEHTLWFYVAKNQLSDETLV